MGVLEKIYKSVELNWDLIQNCFQEALNDLAFKKMHLKAIQESIAESSETLEWMGSLLEERRSRLKGREMEIDLSQWSLKDLELKKSDLFFICKFMTDQDKLMEELFEKMELERKQFETNRKKTDDKILEIFLKRHGSLINIQTDNRATELDKREENLERRMKEIEMREVALASKKAELIAKENELEGREKNLDLKNKLLSTPIDYSKLLINDFGKHRLRECFEVGQTWACYRSVGNYFLPKLYVKIIEVLDTSEYSFKVRVACLREPNHWNWYEVRKHEGWEAWLQAGLPLGCGYFRRTIMRFRYHHHFSHQMSCEDSSYHIYPCKGEIWALYKDWDITTWASNCEYFQNCKFEVAEILEIDYSSRSIKVAYLEKIAGFVSLFQRRSQDENESFLIQRSDIFIFSHKVPSFQMTGNEIEGVPDGSFELDPKALPADSYDEGSDDSSDEGSDDSSDEGPTD